MKKPRKLKQENCIECSKKGIWCKKLCQACYSKMRRKTPEGILQLKNYNAVKGKEANKRYLDKQPKKEPKYKLNIVCECGKNSVAKGMCRNCYQNKWNDKNYSYNKKEKVTIDYSEIYLKILKSVKKGMTIQNACKSNGFNSTAGFYKNISEKQKTELRSYKSINKIQKIDDYEY